MNFHDDDYLSVPHVDSGSLASKANETTDVPVSGRVCASDNSRALEPVELEMESTGRPTVFYCPRCPDQYLVIGLLHKVQVCYCELCRGMLIDSPTFGPFLTALRAEYRAPDAPPRPLDQSALGIQIACTVCHQPMETHPYCGPGTVVVNSCQHCQIVWLDRGELSTIIRAPGNRATH
jgi:Zn-finger nucleic acid-binding protein